MPKRDSRFKAILLYLNSLPQMFNISLSLKSEIRVTAKQWREDNGELFSFVPLKNTMNIRFGSYRPYYVMSCWRIQYTVLPSLIFTQVEPSAVSFS